MSLFLKVYFISSNNQTDVISQHFPKFFDPVFYFGEAIGIGDVINKYSPIGISVQSILDLGDFQKSLKSWKEKPLYLESYQVVVQLYLF